MNLTMKRNILLLFTIIIFVSGVISPALVSNAETPPTYADAERNFNEQSQEYLKDTESIEDVLRLLDEDNKSNPNPSRDSINYVMKRLFYPGVYVNDVRDAVVASELKKEKDELLFNGKNVCGSSMPTNLISHNCNVPNFTTSLLQNLVDPFTPPTNNAETTSSYADFGLGVPNDIPGGVVPVDPASRVNSYTALELFGYDLKLTSYNGEWDNVVVSNQARMLSNFGVVDRITLIGTSLWNSVSTGISTFVENFSFNPTRWFSSIGKTFGAAVSAGVNTVVDTSELNVIATNAFKRPRLDGTLYNVYVMTDAEILRETYMNYFTIFSGEMDLKTNENAKLQEVVALNPGNLNKITPFNYDPNWETDESKAARETAQAQRDSEIAHNQSEQLLASHSEEPYTPNLIDPLTEVPEPVYYTEKEQLGFWSENPDVADFTGKAQNNGLIEGAPGTYETYSEMVSDWEAAYTPFFTSNFDALGETVKEIIEDTDVEVFLKYPHLDPKQSISKYACANPDGSIMRKSDGSVEYLYLANNTKTSETLNSKCSPAREPIGAGYLGHGWDNPEITDTRHVSHVSEDGLGIGHKISNGFTSLVMSINSFVAKITNVIINLSFSPLMEKLGITLIVEKIVEGFRDTVFFPLATIFGAVGALLLFFEVIRTGSIMRIFGSLFITILIFVSGSVFLLHPGSTMAVIDKLPTMIDNILADAILVEDDGSTYCSTGTSQDGIRSAQCNVWGAMVFEPWVHLQFGTGYDSLYANGKAPSGSKAFSNTNQELVGDASVNMGGGNVVNNWALYQLEVTKAGTINAKDNSGKVGVVDKNFFRLVDLQAGPDNAAESDTRHFAVWSGKDKDGGLVLLTLASSILLAVAIGGIGLAKIEVTFMFALLMTILPIMLLAGLLPQGQPKLKGYVANLGSLLLRKTFLVILMAVLLRIITSVYSSADSLTTASVISIFVSIAFILYRKEIMDIVGSNSAGAGMLGSHPEQLREQVAKVIPTGIKQYYSVAKANVRGATAGFIGGAIGTAEQSVAIRRERSAISLELANIEHKIAGGKIDEETINKRDELRDKKEAIDYAIAQRKSLSTKKLSKLTNESNNLYLKIKQNELEIKKMIAESSENNTHAIAELSRMNERLEEKREEIAVMAAGGVRRSKGVLTQAMAGSVHSRNLIGRSSERKLRTQGYAGFTAVRDIRESVLAQGAKDIADQKESVEYDVYQDVLNRSKSGINRDLEANLNSKERGQLESAKVQRQVRELAEARREIAKNNPSKAAVFSEQNIKEFEEVAKTVDTKRKLEKAKDIITSPIESYNTHVDERKSEEKSKGTNSRTSVIIEEIETHLKEDGRTSTGNNGETIVTDRELNSKFYTSDDHIEVDVEFERELSQILSEIKQIEEEHRRNIAAELNRIEAELMRKNKEE